MLRGAAAAKAAAAAAAAEGGNARLEKALFSATWRSRSKA
jgi:hypothetical protein